MTHNLVLGRHETLICFQRCQSVSLTSVRPPIFLWQCQYPNNRATTVECKFTLHKCRFSMSKFFTDISKIFVIINIVTHLLFCKNDLLLCSTPNSTVKILVLCIFFGSDLWKGIQSINYNTTCSQLFDVNPVSFLKFLHIRILPGWCLAVVVPA